jgi:hypothetical protein
MNRTAVILVIVMLLIGLVGGFFLRPVIVKQVDTTVEDSLRFEVRKWQERAEGFETDADFYRQQSDSLRRNPITVTKHLPHVQRTIHAGGLDAIRDSLLARPN